MPFTKGHTRGDNPRPKPSIEGDLRTWVRNQAKPGISAKQKRNLLLKACGLESTFAPRIVLENLKRDSDGNLIVIATGRDGRILWSGKTKQLQYLTENQVKFSTPWSSTSKVEMVKAKRFSYLVRVLSEHGAQECTIKPLVRLSLQYFRLNLPNFYGLVRKVLSTVISRIVRVDGPLRCYSLQSKPFLLRKRKDLGLTLGTVPLWDWRRFEPSLLGS